MKRNKQNLIAASAFFLTLVMLLLPGAVTAQTVWVDPEASKQLEATLNYLGDLKQFSVKTHNTIDEIIEPGQKVQFDFTATLTVQRPGKLLVERHGEVVDQVLYYDGTMLTLYDTASNYFAKTYAPDTIEAMLIFAQVSLGLAAPASDLLARDVYPLMIQDVYSATIVGEADFGGTQCVHLAFSRPDVDFQIWVPKTGKPLPCKYVITDKNSFGQLSVGVVMSDWNLAPKISDSTFNFEPPKDAASTEFMLLDANGNYVQ